MGEAISAGPLQRVQEAAIASRWRWRGAAFLTGALSILSMAPFFVWPILWLTLPTLLWLMANGPAHVQRRERKRARWLQSIPQPIRHAAAAGWWFGFGYHVFGLFWVGEAFLVEAEIFAWLLPFAVTLLPAGLALFFAAACAFTVWAAPRDGVVRVLAFALGIGVAEWLRGHVFTGLPWNVLGYALTAGPLMPLASVFGIYGLTLIAGLVFTLPAVWFTAQPMRHVMACASIAIALGLASVTFGMGHVSYGLNLGCTKSGGECYPIVRIVQSSVPQREKWRPENRRAIFDDHLALSMTNAKGETDDAKGIALIVWPEAALPFLPLNEPVAMAELGSMIPEAATLVTGALRADPLAGPGAPRRIYNSLLVFGRGAPNATVLATYDKTHLVPFGEYLPLQRVLEAIGLQQLSRMRGGFASGPEPRPLIDIPRLGKIAPLICYEAIFPARVIQSKERPRVMVNVTNDGWFGNTTGPRQHLHMARIRAVEEGVPVIRAANNGISAVIDAYGRVTARLDLNVRGTLDSLLPPAIAPPLYAQLGDALFFAGVLILILYIYWLRFRQFIA